MLSRGEGCANRLANNAPKSALEKHLKNSVDKLEVSEVIVLAS